MFMDDIIVFGRTPEEHDANLAKVKAALVAANVTLNDDKCHFRQAMVKFLGHVVSADGLQPSPDKVSAVRELNNPKDAVELRRMMGLFTYLGRFIPNLSEVSAPLRSLLHDDAEWLWTDKQQEAFDALKALISSAPCLAFFDPALPIIVSADASSYGLGAVLLQDHDGTLRPVAYASRSLTSTEQQYAQIEKECLAVVWGCERFHGYIYGSDALQVHTDHKPLIPLINTRDLTKVPLRCQRLLMRLLRYSPEAVYVPGKQLVLADTLSRSPAPLGDHFDDVTTLTEEIQASLPSITAEIMSPTMEARLANATSDDPTLCRVREFVKSGWPATSSDIASSVTPYFNERHLLSEHAGVLFHGQRIVIPPQLQDEILTKLHDGHQGVTKTRARARGSVWWPGLSVQIATKIAECHECSKFRHQHREPLQPVTRPPLPWHTIGADLMEFNGTTYLVVIDYFSRYLEVLPMRATSSTAVIRRLHTLFAAHGIPAIVVSDNGPQFASQEFADFADHHSFGHRTSSPRYPQSNGESERAVRTAKDLLRKGDCLEDALLAYRSTPLASGYTPSQLLYGRIIRSHLPTTTTQLQPQWPDIEQFLAAEDMRQQAQKSTYDDRHAAQPMRPLLPGDLVWITDLQKEGEVKEQLSNRSFLVQCGSSVLRRNRIHLNRLPPRNTTTGHEIEVQFQANQPDQQDQPQLPPRRSSRQQPGPKERLIEVMQ